MSRQTSLKRIKFETNYSNVEIIIRITNTPSRCWRPCPAYVSADLNMHPKFVIQIQIRCRLKSLFGGFGCIYYPYIQDGRPSNTLRL